MAPTNKTIALITGANQGVGRAVATSLARDHGYHVIIGARDPSAGAEAASALAAQGLSASWVQLDLGSDASIAAAVANIEADFGALDVLVNNAGILLDRTPQPLPTRELWSRTFDTNVFGAVVLTELCVPLLRRAKFARVVFVSSRMGSLEASLDKSTIYYALDYKVYDASKAAMNMLAVNYARILDDVGAAVNVACPGLVRTQLTRFSMGEAPEVGAKRIVELATLEKRDVHGTFSDLNGAIPW